MREVLFNIVKHAQTSQARLVLEERAGDLQLQIEDAGVGFDVEQVLATTYRLGGYGLRSIVERIRLMGGVVCGMAASGEDALVQLAQTPPDLALVDISLPGMNGCELIERLHAAQPELPILAISGHPASQYQAEGTRGGARDYIEKIDAPFTLLPRLRALLGAQ